MNKLFHRLLVGLALGIGVYTILAIWVGARDLGSSLGQFRLWLFLPILGLTFSNYLLRFLKWAVYLRVIGVQVPWGLNLNIFLSGLSMTVTPGKVGELLKSYLVRQSCGVPMSRTAPVVIAERITDLLALVALLTVGFMTFRRFFFLIAIVGGTIVCLIAVISSRRLSMAILRRLSKLPGLRRIGSKIEEFYESTATLFGLWPLTISTILSILAWFCECLGFYLVLSGFPAVEPSLLLAVFIYSAMTLAGVVTPGGIGVTDGGMMAMLNLISGLTAAIAGAATFIIRLCTLWFAVLVGVCALLIFKWRFGFSDTVYQDLRNEAQADR